MIKLFIILIGILSSCLYSQVVPHNIPLSHNLENTTNYTYLNQELNQIILLKPNAPYNENNLFQLGVVFKERGQGPEQTWFGPTSGNRTIAA